MEEAGLGKHGLGAHIDVIGDGFELVQAQDLHLVVGRDLQWGVHKVKGESGCSRPTADCSRQIPM
jgi:hypothetical protein